MPNPGFELDPFTQALVDDKANAYGMSFEDMANEYASTMGDMAEATTPYGDAVAAKEWKEGKLDNVGKILTAASLLPGAPNIRQFRARTFRNSNPWRSIDALVNPTKEDIAEAMKWRKNVPDDGEDLAGYAAGAGDSDSWRAVVDGSTGKVYAWPALDALHADVMHHLAKEGTAPESLFTFMSGDKQWDELFDPKVSKKIAEGFKYRPGTFDQSEQFLKEFFGSK